MKFLSLMSFLLLMTISQTSFAERKVGEITESESTAIKRRVEARNYTLFAFGPSNFSNMSQTYGAKSIMLGYLYEVNPYAAVTLKMEGGFQFEDKNESIIAGTLGGRGYFTPYDISPFLGADFGYGGAVSDDDDIDNVAGWAAGVSGGVVFFRTASVQLQLFVRHLVIFSDNKEGQPGHSSLNLGIAF